MLKILLPLTISPIVVKIGVNASILLLVNSVLVLMYFLVIGYTKKKLMTSTKSTKGVTIAEIKIVAKISIKFPIKSSSVF